MDKKDILTGIKKVPFHTFLFSIYHVLFFHSRHYYQYNPGAVLIVLAVIIALTFVFWRLMSLLVGDGMKAGIVTTAAIVLFYSYGHIFMKVKSASPYDFSAHGVSPNYVLFPLVVLAFILCVYFVRRSGGSSLPLIAMVLNAMGLVLTLFVLSQVLWNYAHAQKVFNETRAAVQDRDIAGADAALDPSGLPDIYYIILDMYARDDMLRDEFGFDNSDFTGFLRSRGFYIADKSTSNYKSTDLSLASSLNFRYLEEVSERMGKGSRNRLPLEYMIKKNRAASVLKRFGYIQTTFPPGAPWWQLDNKCSDQYVTDGPIMNRVHETVNYLHRLFFMRTALSAVNGLTKKAFGFEIKYLLMLDSHLVRKTTLFILDTVPTLSGPDAPRFVYVHFSAGHTPQLFGKDGEPIYNNDLTQYTNSVIFMNKKVREMVDGILDNASRPSVIIIQGDHGILKGGNLGDEKEFAILNAIYMGGKESGLLYESITPVNTFRVIFREYLGMEIELLKDKNFMYEDWFYPYDETEITERMSAGAPVN